MNDNKRIVKNTMFMYFRMFFSMCVGLYTSRVILANLGYTDYGLNNVVGGIITMFTFINAGMTSTTSRFITFHLGKNDKDKLATVFSTSFFIHCILAAIIVLLGETIGLWFLYNKMVIPEDRMTAALWLYHLSVISTGLRIITIPFSSDIVAHEKMSIYAYLSIFNTTMHLIIVLLIPYSPVDKLIFYALLSFFLNALNLLFYHVYCRLHYYESRIRWVWDGSLLKEMFGFTGWNMVGSFSFMFYTQGLNILLNMFCGPVVNAARGIAVQVQSNLSQFTANIQTAINPQIIKSYSQGDTCRMETLVFASSRYCFYLMLLLTIPVIINVEFLLNIWLESVPDHTVNFIRLTLLLVLLDTFINPLYTANLASGKVGVYNKVLAINSFSFMPITYFGLKYTGVPEMVFLINIISTVVGIIARVFIYRYQLKVGIWDYVINVFLSVGKVTILSCIVPFVCYWFLGGETFKAFIITSSVSVFSILATVYFIGLNDLEKQSVLNYSKSIINNAVGK